MHLAGHQLTRSERTGDSKTMNIVVFFLNNQTKNLSKQGSTH